MPTASPIVRDLSINGGGLAVVGIAGLVASSFAASGGPARAIVPFLIVALVFGLAQVVVSGGWLRTAVAEAAIPPDALVAEQDSGTFRRCAMPTVLALVLVLSALLVWPQFAAMLSGLAFAAGMTDLRARQWILAVQREDDVIVMREVTPLPFSTSRRAIWAQPGRATAD